MSKQKQNQREHKPLKQMSIVFFFFFIKSQAFECNDIGTCKREATARVMRDAAVSSLLEHHCWRVVIINWNPPHLNLSWGGRGGHLALQEFFMQKGSTIELSLNDREG